MASLTKLLRCTKLFGSNCDFIHKAKTVDEIMHVFSGHIAEEHADIMKKLSPQELKKAIEENIETIK